MCFIAGLVLLTQANQSYAAPVWGSFDATRLRYRGAELSTGIAHNGLRRVITSTGGVIAPGTSKLTSSYLSGVDVFYTSLLDPANPSRGTLSVSEQSALMAWVVGGGTLIVTSAFDSFTSVYGLTGRVSHRGGPIVSVTADHPITTGVSRFSYTYEAEFSLPAEGLVLAKDSSGDPFMVVLEPDTGFHVGGRVVVVADHEVFSDGYISFPDNQRLAMNLAIWSVPEPTSLLLLTSMSALLAPQRRRS